MENVTRRDVIAACEECERNAMFDVHVDPVDPETVLSVDENFEFIPKTKKVKAKRWFDRTFLIKPYSWYQNSVVLKTKVYGRKNLKGIKSAITTCNHVYMFDCLAILRALKGHKVKFTVAEFNNRKGFLGEMMRSAGILPITGKLKVVKQFNHAVEHYLLHDNYVTFYPEQAMWYLYEKPRPYKIGAFHYAVKFDVPVIPMFISYRPSGKIVGEGLEHKYFTVHILKPIYPDKTLSPKDAAEQMRVANYRAVKEKYEEIYGKPLTYTCGEVAE